MRRTSSRSPPKTPRPAGTPPSRSFYLPISDRIQRIPLRSQIRRAASTKSSKRKYLHRLRRSHHFPPSVWRSLSESANEGEGKVWVGVSSERHAITTSEIEKRERETHPDLNRSNSTLTFHLLKLGHHPTAILRFRIGDSCDGRL
ncbi:hypothetical protein BHE74_00012793 [Ensete ventricosum]|nr:hypothetical protein GW17_00011744 [Ensete ventricosum]RWW78949.1 hypothetical protein BHE74_00012793 [Ensete ventricosum]